MDIVNRTSGYLSVFYNFIFLCKGSLGIDGSHSEERAEPHPEDGSGAAAEKCSCSTGQITGTYLSGNCGCNRLEGGHFARFLLTLVTKVTKEKLEALSKFSYLNELEFYGVEDTRTT